MFNVQSKTNWKSVYADNGVQTYTAAELTLSLAQWVNNANSHWSMCDIGQYGSISASEAICFLNSHVVPVGPVHPVFEHRQ